MLTIKKGNKMIRVMVSCANGAGSSLMIKLKLENFCKEKNVKAIINHYPLVQGVEMARDYDVVITAKPFVKEFDKYKKGRIIIGLNNIMNDSEIKFSFENALEKLKWKI